LKKKINEQKKIKKKSANPGNEIKKKNQDYRSNNEIKNKLNFIKVPKIEI
jgi:hypothetical protein